MGKDKLTWTCLRSVLRCWQAAFGLALGIIGGGIGNAAADKWYPGTTRFETIEAQKIMIVNKMGKIVLGDQEHAGFPYAIGLKIFNDTDKETVSLGAGVGGGGFITIKSSNGGLTSFGGGSLSLSKLNKRNKRYLFLRLDSNGLHMRNTADNKLIWLRRDDEYAGLFIYNALGKEVVDVGASLNGGGFMRIGNKRGHTVARLP